MFTCDTTKERYIGVTVMKGTAKWKTLRQRWQGHVYKALILGENWGISQAIKTHGEQDFWMEILDVIRGKEAAFKLESTLINTLKPELNLRRKKHADNQLVI